MKKLPTVLVTLVLGAAGFAAAGIASGANLMDVLTGTTATGETETGPEGTTTGEHGAAGRRVLVCHATHSKRHPFVQITVSERALKGLLRHGSYLGQCNGATSATTDAATTTSPGDETSGHGHGHGQDHGQGQGHGHH